jgi:hypothetical protein
MVLITSLRADEPLSKSDKKLSVFLSRETRMKGRIEEEIM